MSAPRRGKSRGGPPPEEHNDERWMASYMDMVTVLMCLFIVLFAMSSVDAEKFAALKSSLATGFGSETSETVDTAEGLVVPPERVGEVGETLTDTVLAQQEIASLEAIRDQINAGLVAGNLQDNVRFTIDERGLTVGLVGAATFFGGNSTDLSPIATDILNTVGPVVQPLPHEISVEGHADPHGSSGPFPTDWELSSGRATMVVRYLVERGGVAAGRVGALGRGSSRPSTTDASPAGQSLNRRVDIVVLSAQTEAVRGLIPDLLESPPTTTPEAAEGHGEKAEPKKKEAPKKEAPKEKESAGGH